MAILNFVVSSIGETGQVPSFIYLNTTDSPSTVAAAGYLDDLVSQGIPISALQMALVVTTGNPVVQLFNITKSGSVYTLVPYPSGGGSGGGFTWNVETGATALVKGNAYVANSSSQVAFTLPATAAVGDTYLVAGYGSGGWIVDQNTGQSIKYLSNTTTVGTGGSIASASSPEASIFIVCVIANTGFLAYSGIGNVTIT